MKVKTSFCCVLMIFCLHQLHAQSNYQPGFLVKPGGDTLHGYIDRKEWSKNPLSVSFKTKPDGVAEEYEQHDINSFTVANDVTFVGYFVPISMDGIDINQNSSGVSHVGVPDSVFMKVLQHGKNVTLLSYRDFIKTRYFLQEKNALPVELEFQEYMDGTDFKTSTFYRNQLIVSANTHGILTEKLGWYIKKAPYKASSLEEIVRHINGVENQKTVSLDKDGNRLRKVNYFIGGGLSTNSVTYGGDGVFADHAHSEKTFAPYFSVGLDRYLNPKVRKLLVRGELNFTTMRNKLLTYDNTFTYPQHMEYDINLYNLSLSGLLIYNLYNGHNAKLYFGSGVRVSQLIYKDNAYMITTNYANDKFVYRENDFFVMNKRLLSIPIQLGFIVYNKVELKATYNYSLLPLNHNTIPLTEYYRNCQFGVNYFLR